MKKRRYADLYDYTLDEFDLGWKRVLIKSFALPQSPGPPSSTCTLSLRLIKMKLANSLAVDCAKCVLPPDLYIETLKAYLGSAGVRLHQFLCNTCYRCFAVFKLRLCSSSGPVF